MDHSDAALGDLTILDFSRVLAGPLATMLLGDLGATVIKVERPGAGDDTRGWGPPWGEAGESTYYLSVNRNKRSVALDLSREADRAHALALARRADVVVENFRAGTMERLGLGYETLRAGNPDLVYCALSGFGGGGGASLPGYDLLAQALGGVMSVTGTAEGEPTKVGVAAVDVLAGLFAAIGILAALRHRDRTGGGQRVDVDLLSAALAGLVNQTSAYLNAGVVPGRMGNAHPSIAPYETYAAADGPLVIAVGTDRQFHALCEALEAPELAGDERFQTNADRVANRDALRARIERALAARPAHEWADALHARGVPAGVVNDLAGAVALAERLGLDPIARIERADGTSAAAARNPIGLSATPPRYAAPPPALGEHTAEVLDELGAR